MDETDELVTRLRQRDKTKHGYSGNPLYNRDGPEAAARIEALTAERAAAIARAEAAEAALRRGQTYSASVAVCPICDIAGCSHLTTKHGEQP